MSDKLKPCPFCGSDKVSKRFGNPCDFSYLKCSNCGASTNLMEDFNAVIAKWNHRPTESALVEALRELLAAESAQFPPYSAGAKAQEDWANRKHEAKKNANKALASAEGL